MSTQGVEEIYEYLLRACRVNSKQEYITDDQGILLDKCNKNTKDNQEANNIEENTINTFTQVNGLIFTNNCLINTGTPESKKRKIILPQTYRDISQTIINFNKEKKELNHIDVLLVLLPFINEYIIQDLDTKSTRNQAIQILKLYNTLNDNVHPDFEKIISAKEKIIKEQISFLKNTNNKLFPSFSKIQAQKDKNDKNIAILNGINLGYKQCMQTIGYKVTHLTQNFMHASVFEIHTVKTYNTYSNTIKKFIDEFNETLSKIESPPALKIQSFVKGHQARSKLKNQKAQQLEKEIAQQKADEERIAQEQLEERIAQEQLEIEKTQQKANEEAITQKQLDEELLKKKKYSGIAR